MDEKLKKAIQLMRKGDERGFNEVYSATYNLVYFKAKQYFRREEDVLDTVQMTYVAAYRSIKNLKSDDAFFSWLKKITCNQAMKHIEKMDMKYEVLLKEESAEMFDIIETEDVSVMPEVTMEQKMTAEIVRGFVEELPEMQKAAVVAYYFDGLEVKQIAENMECSEGTIKSRLNYAREKIKERVEALERKQGFKIHAVGAPVLWYAIKLIADETTLTVQAAQEVYNGACTEVGLQATPLVGTGGTAAAVAMAEAGAGAMDGNVTGATTAGVAEKVAGTATLGKTAKTVIVSGAIALAGLGLVGLFSLLGNPPEKTTEEATTMERTYEFNNDIVEKPFVDIEMTDEAQHQISAFAAAAYQCSYSSVKRGEDWTFAEMTPDECLFFVKDYIGMVNFRMGEGGEANPADLPYDWVNYNVTREEFVEFCKSGLGIEIPDDYSCYVEKEWGTLQIADGKLITTFDERTLQIVGDSVEVVSQNAKGVVLKGTCYWFSPEKEEFRFMIYGTASGNSEILGGITVQSIKIAETETTAPEYRFDSFTMSQKCRELLMSISHTGYYVGDVDKDKIPELIVCSGMSNADSKYVVYSFDGENLIEEATLPYGTLYGSDTDKALYVKYTQMGYEIVYKYDMNATTKISELTLQSDGTGGYEFGTDVYSMTEHTDLAMGYIGSRLNESVE